MKTIPLLAALAGLAAGLFAGFFLFRTTEGAAVPAGEMDRLEPATASSSEVIPRSAPSLDERVLEPAGATTSGRTALEESAPIFGPRLAAFGEAGLGKGWALERTDEITDEALKEGLDAYRQAVLDLPVFLGRRLAERENERDLALADAAAGGAMALLAKLDGGGVGPLFDVVASPKAFEKLFPRTAAETQVNGLDHLKDTDKALSDGATLVLPAGVFRLADLMQEKDPFPKDVKVTGAGMNATLVLMGNLSTRGELRNFQVADCTVFTANDYLFDLRGEPATMQFDRARLIGFDMGAGSSCLFGTEELAVWMRSCVIEGGYGRNPKYGQLFDVRTDALLARFDHCTIDEVQIAPHLFSGSTVVFANCALTNVLDYDFDALQNKSGLSFLGSTLSPLPDPFKGSLHKDLNQLFPNWQQRIEPK